MYPCPFNFAGVKKWARAADAGQGCGLLASPSPFSVAPCAFGLAVMTGKTEGLKVLRVEPCASVLDLDDMVHKRSGRCPALFQTFFAERMGAAVHDTQLSPFARIIELMTAWP